ncbi:MAG: hypothetical protein NTZ16_16245 [Verrucomicrobia bacterium]|nr:hypothetical protein [Verrucomicrobiota bacterium]
MKHLFAILSILLAAINPLSATDLRVEENGTSGAYTTINAALAAANAGDRIYVYPKYGGAAYVENLILTLTNIQLINATEGQRFKVDGTITLNAGCQLIGAELTNIDSTVSHIIDGGGSNSNVRIINCKVIAGNVIASATGAKTWIDNDSIMNGFISFYNGRISGCYVKGSSPFGCIQLLSGAPTSNDTALVVGNKVEHYMYVDNSWAVWLNSSSVFTYASNNYIHSYNPFYVNSGIGLNFYGAKYSPSSSAGNSIINNTVCKTGTVTSFNNNFQVILTTSTCIAFYNNISISIGQPSLMGFFFNGIDGVNFEYNYDINSATPFVKGNSAGTFSSTNISNSNSSIDINTGSLNGGSDAINGGHPSALYLDLDLTRNDAGCYGGSYSLANFMVSETGARVLFMKAPRTVFATFPITISGEGVDK